MADKQLKQFLDEADKLKNSNPKAYRKLLGILSDRWYFEVYKAAVPEDFVSIEEEMRASG